MSSPECFALIPDERGERVLVHALAAGWSLPRLSIAQPFWWQDVMPVNLAAKEQLGLRSTTLCCFRILYHGPQPGTARRIFVLEPEEWLASKALVNARWVTPRELRDLDLSWPEMKSVVDEWFDSPPVRVPWYQRRWRDEPFAWVTGQLAQAQMPIVAAPTQVRSWERSALWRFETEAGPAYFKAVGGPFQLEPTLSTQLSRWVPGRVSEIIAAAPERGWLLLRDAGQNTLSSSRSCGEWESAMRQYGQTQMGLIDHAHELLSFGVPDRRVQHLPARAAALLNDSAALARSSARLSEDEIAQLWKLLPGLTSGCEALASSPIPPSLEHGDLTAGQFLTTRPLARAMDAVIGAPSAIDQLPDSRYRVIDWSDSSLAFPFFSMLFFWAELGDSFDDPNAVRERLRDAYLLPWTKLAGRAELERLYEVAMQVAPWHYAVTYHRTILPAMSVGWEMECMLPYYLRLALSAARDIE